MERLKDRQQELLGMIVETYVETINPVGSQTIAKLYPKLISPATIRNEMHDLEEREYIMHPHTSAGRIPTDKGYRYYVDHLMAQSKEQHQKVESVMKEYEHHIESVDALIERTSRILSTLTEQAGFVILPSFETTVLKRIEMTRFGVNHLLVVWVTANGFVQDRMIDMGEELSDEEIARLHVFLNRELSGLPLTEIKSFLMKKLENTRDSLRSLYETASRIVSESYPGNTPRKVTIEGSGNILSQPEFQDWVKSKQLFKMLESKNSFIDWVGGQTGENRVEVKIGTEHGMQDLWDCAFVTARYSVGRDRMGVIGVVGPRRMAYQRVVSIVDNVSMCFEDIFRQWG